MENMHCSLVRATMCRASQSLSNGGSATGSHLKVAKASKQPTLLDCSVRNHDEENCHNRYRNRNQRWDSGEKDSGASTISRSSLSHKNKKRILLAQTAATGSSRLFWKRAKLPLFLLPIYLDLLQSAIFTIFATEQPMKARLQDERIQQ